MHITPIHDEADYDRALVRIDALMGASLHTPEGDELDILTTLVEAYEARHYAIGPADSVAAIRFRMDQMGLEQKDLTPVIGSRSKVSEVLNHKRPLSLNMIRNLHAILHVPLESLITPAKS